MKSRKVFSRAVALTCAAVLTVTSLVGCGNQKQAEESNTTKAEESTAQAATTEQNKYQEHIVFTMNAIDADKVGKDDNGQPDKTFEWLKKKFNFDVEWIPCTWQDYFLEKPRIWMASGDQPDIMMMDVAPARYPYFLKWVSDGQFTPYENYEQYPNLKKAMDKANNGKKFIIDGKLQAFPAFRDSAQYNYILPPTTVYRSDWAEAVGKRKADDVYTWDEWLDLVKTVIEKDPGKNGAGKTLGMASVDFVFPNLFPYRDISPNMLTYTKKDGKWVWGASLPETFEAIKLTKQLYDEGLIDKDQILIKSGDDLVQKFSAGKLFSSIDTGASPDSINQFSSALEKATPGIDVEKAVSVALIKGVNGKIVVNSSSDHWTETTMSKNITAEKAKRWMEILDYMASDEGYHMRNFGIPEEDWSMDGDKLNVKWPKDTNGNVVAPSGLKWANSWQWARAACSDCAQNDSPLYADWQKNIIKKVYDRLSKDDVETIPFDTELNYFSAPNYNKVGTMERDTYQKIASLMPLKADKIEAEWNKWLKEQESKINPVLEELNTKLK